MEIFRAQTFAAEPATMKASAPSGYYLDTKKAPVRRRPLAFDRGRPVQGHVLRL